MRLVLTDEEAKESLARYTLPEESIPIYISGYNNSLAAALVLLAVNMMISFLIPEEYRWISLMLILIVMFVWMKYYMKLKTIGLTDKRLLILKRSIWGDVTACDAINLTDIASSQISGSRDFRRTSLATSMFRGTKVKLALYRP